jgi:acetolactate synthase I/II/III large subunit
LKTRINLRIGVILRLALQKLPKLMGSKFTVNDDAEIENALARMWRHHGEPFLLQVLLDMDTNVYPKIAFGFPMTAMEPFAKPVNFEKS